MDCINVAEIRDSDRLVDAVRVRRFCHRVVYTAPYPYSVSALPNPITEQTDFEIPPRDVRPNLVFGNASSPNVSERLKHRCHATGDDP